MNLLLSVSQAAPLRNAILNSPQRISACLMGMGTVFFGLICLIALTYLMSAVVGRGKKAAPAPVPAAPQTAGEVTPELVAAVSAALAEELGTDITGIRIVSMKKV